MVFGGLCHVLCMVCGLVFIVHGVFGSVRALGLCVG